MKTLFILLCFLGAQALASNEQAWLVKFASLEYQQKFLDKHRSEANKIGLDLWLMVHGNYPDRRQQLLHEPGVIYVQPNYTVQLFENNKVQDENIRALLAQLPSERVAADNPPIPGPVTQSAGIDPLIGSQWGMLSIGANEVWPDFIGERNLTVAVIDTGVDYTHEDLLPNLWRNENEMGRDANGEDKATNGVDDDGNGYVDDVIGWDFVSNDNKPYDLHVTPLQAALAGGNLGHGTHCAGNVAARGNNGVGIAGVAPGVQVMAIRFLSEKGQGTVAEAIKAIRYAVDNDARVLSNSWGSAGEDADTAADNLALREIIEYAQKKGVLFIAAAGNGNSSGIGYDNDSNPQPVYPASYTYDNIISVAAVDSTSALAKFSNFGVKTVDLGAPGVKIFSTVPEGKYTDTVFNFFGLKPTWDGTSMATPHVAGAAALYWSRYPEKSWEQVKAAILNSVTKTEALNGKTSTGGELNVENLMRAK